MAHHETRALVPGWSELDGPEQVQAINEMRVPTWNVACPNGNPLEYWCSHDNQEYLQLMSSVEKKFKEPGSSDHIVNENFTADLYRTLKSQLSSQGLKNLADLDVVWHRDLSQCKSISGFIKDNFLGQKRLISMPDRITGYIHMEHGCVLFRPSAGNGEDISTVEKWWPAWIKFMFHTSICIRVTEYPNVFSRLETNPRAKYPALTAQEEAISIPLQALCLAVFDAILIHHRPANLAGAQAVAPPRTARGQGGGLRRGPAAPLNRR